MKKLLIPIDGSKNSKKALLEAKKLAKELSSEVIILYVEKVEKLPGAFADVTTPDIRKDDHEIGQEVQKGIIDDGLEVFKDFKGEVSSNIESGDPAEVIIQVAEREKVDLIVMGSRGLSGIDRFLLGSVSNKVLNHASSSVLIIR